MTRNSNPAETPLTPESNSQTKPGLSSMKTTTQTSHFSKLKQYGPLLVLVAIMVVAFLSGLHKHFTLKELALNLENLTAFIEGHFLLALLAYVSLYILITALSLPAGAVVTVAGGLLFGWFLGTLATVIGATIGAVAIFLVARSSLGSLLREKAGPWLTQLEAGFQDNSLSYMFFLRLIPAFPFWLVNIAPAFLGVKLSHYIFATFFGIIPGTLAFSYIGEGLESVIMAQKQTYDACLATAISSTDCDFGLDASALVTKEILIALLLLSLVALIPVVIKRLRGRKDQA